MSPEELFYRLGVAAGLGFIIGYERELHGRSAGLKTQVIVAVGSCLIMIISLELEALHIGMGGDTAIRVDPGRIASYAVAGMGFLGAGAIIQGKGSVQGVTTAACLWCGNAAGLASGAGFILPAVAATALIMAVLILLSPLSHRIPRDVYWRLYLDFDGCADRSGELRQLLEEHGIHVVHAGFDCRFNKSFSTYEVAIRTKSTRDMSDLMSLLRRLEGLVGLKWTEGYVP